MKSTMIGVALVAALTLSAGTALAQAGTMQPIPNPPEKPAAAKHHHGMRHAKAHHMKHHAKHHMAKTSDATPAK